MPVRPASHAAGSRTDYARLIGDDAPPGGCDADMTAHDANRDAPRRDDASTRPIPIEEVARYPRPGTAVPLGHRFQPGGRLLTYLASPDGGLGQCLMGHDLDTGANEVLAVPPGPAGEEQLSLEERLRRERLRQRAVGITSYAWSDDGGRVMVPLLGAIHVMDAPGNALREVVPTGDHPALDARFSPSGLQIAFVRDAELHVVPVEGGAAVQITTGARGTGRTNGLAEFVAQEEMERLRGYWWAPDSSCLAFTEVDETHIPAYRIMHQGKASVGYGAEEDHRYPFAGAPNARVRLGVVAAAGGDVVWMDLGADEDVYLARVGWFADGALAVQMLNREQSELRLLRLDPETGAATELLRETSEVWINLHRCFRALKEGDLAGCFLWASERTGFQHLELRAADGSLVRTLTAGDWIAEAVARVDEARGRVLFMGTRDGATERHLYAVPLAGGEPQRITAAAGMHIVVVDSTGDTFVDRRHALDQPPVVELCDAHDGSVVQVLSAPDDVRIAELALVPPKLVHLSSRDGQELCGALYTPAGEGPWPVVISVYGGPHAQRITNGWDMTVDLRAQSLRRRGYLVFVVDNRGAARRGLAFEGALRHAMGTVEVRDQVDGVRWLVEQGLGDPDRVAIYGWSYGGFMAAMCLAQEPDVFRAAVSGAPVTAWDGYDTCYTERYMGTPQSNPDGYAQGAVMTHIEGLRGRLLLVHGLIDENVHFRHTARLINALIKARKPYELLLFPNERHMPRGEADRVYMEERILAFLEDALAPDA